MTMTEQLYNQQQNPLGSFGNIHGQVGQTGIGGYASSPFGTGIGQSGVNAYGNDPFTSSLQQQLGSQLGFGNQIGRTPYNIDPLTALALQQQQLHQQSLGTSGIGQQLGGNWGVGQMGRTSYNIDPLTALALQQQQMHSQTLGSGLGQQYGGQWGGNLGTQGGNVGMRTQNIDPFTALAIQQQQLQQLQQQVLQQQLIHQQLLQQLTSGSGYGTGMGSNLQSQMGSQNPYGNLYGSPLGGQHNQFGTQFGGPQIQGSQFGVGSNPYSQVTSQLGSVGGINPQTQFGTNPFTQGLGSSGINPSIARTLSGGLNPQQLYSSPWTGGQNVSGQQQFGSQFGQQVSPGLQGLGVGVSQQSVDPTLLHLLSNAGRFGSY